MGTRIEHSGDTRARPPHLRATFLASVALGGAAGAATREGLALAIPPLGDVPVAIALINVSGAFLLGWLFEALAHLTPDDPTARRLRLLLGTGFCGGFTTYSALATGTALLIVDGRPGAAAAYALGTVIVGAFATWAGIALAAGLRARSRPRPSPDGTAR
ncbi:CrcB family protein [Leucobacter sp. cx-87]|nr:CrcB family protein [Leucobacter sp. cx-87]